MQIIKTEYGKRLQIEGELPDGFHGEQQGNHYLCPLDGVNAAALRRLHPWTAPTLVGLRKSAGCGDRLGLATPGHILAIRETDLFPVFAQQSIREMQRAGRTAQDVMDGATWGVFEMDYRSGFGSDADHLKTTQYIDQCIAVGFIGFTLDPSDYVDNAAHTDAVTTLQNKYAALPWERLESTAADLRRKYVGVSPVGEITEEALTRAACKYGAAIAHAAHLARHIASKLDGYDIEVSVDETDTPTSAAEHYFIASELRRLGVNFTGLAPRFIGRFQKGVDYVGDLGEFEDDFAAHSRIARELGPYKLSIHSGSDKFSIYPIIYKYTGQYVHLKTAGTSWLEALRVIAMHDAPLFRQILECAAEHYEYDRASYHVSAELSRIPDPLTDSDLPSLLDNFDARQVLHVTFGSLINQFRTPIYAVLEQHDDAYKSVLKTHFQKHFAPFQG
jgi:tagaturonate epimerase